MPLPLVVFIDDDDDIPLLELWFIVVVYDCHRYLTERRSYMDYCLAYSTPMKTLHSAR